jgi:hypothetical protein
MKTALSNICLICNATVERFVREVEWAFARPDGEIVPIARSVYNGGWFHVFYRVSMRFQEFVYSSFS